MMTMPAVVYEQPSAFSHSPVMPNEVLAALAPERGGTYVDATVGGAGHATAIAETTSTVQIFGFDRDPAAVEEARARLASFGTRARVEHATFDGLEARLHELGVFALDGLLADLGISSPQLDAAERGMSLRREGPLDMRMDPTCGETALELIERLSQDELADVIYNLGEERRSRRVARCIKQALERGELHTTLDLRRAVVRAVGPQRIGGVDPATRTFQALRMAVNDEMGQLGALLDAAPRLVSPGGVVVFISFHSLEDRLVKYALRDRSRWELLNKKPLLASEREQAENPRSRSAKLRAARRREEVVS
jgi:16S rRNA (cytosine1402-N4)-methyltransferase